MKTFVMGDIHGAATALRQCLERSGFDRERDRLVALGDVCDRGLRVKECVEELLKIKNLEYILGNHDFWTLDWARRGVKNPDWLWQGGEETIRSYGVQGMPERHIRLLEEAKAYWEWEGRLFVHGGFDPAVPVARQSLDVLIWDREFLKRANRMHSIDPAHRFGGYDEIYVGHTQTRNFRGFEPVHMCNVWAVDTGAGGNGRLTIMDIKTKQFWQSDFVRDIF